MFSANSISTPDANISLLMILVKYMYIYSIYMMGVPAKWEMMSVLLLFKDANKERYKNK